MKYFPLYILAIIDIILLVRVIQLYRRRRRPNGLLHKPSSWKRR